MAQNPAPTARKPRRPACAHPLADGKKCGLGKGHPGDHKPRTVKKIDRTKISVSEWEDVGTPTAAVAERTAPSRTRDPRQQAVDRVVAAKHEAWSKVAGKPTVWNKIPREVKGVYYRSPDLAEITRAMLRSAGEYHKVRVILGTAARVAAKNPDGSDNPDAGKEIITFAVVDKREAAK